MKKCNMFILGALALVIAGIPAPVPLFAQAPQPAMSAGDMQALVAKADDVLTFMDTDLSALYKIETQAPGGALSMTSATVFRRDKTGQFVVLILEPAADKGKGYLKTGDNIWLYDPVGKTFLFSNATERFQNTSVRNSDFDRSNYSANYKAVKAEKVQLGKYACTLVELQAVIKNITFPKVKIWIDESFLIRKIEDYSLSGQLLRTTAIPSYQQLGKRWLPASIVIYDYLKSKNIQGKIEYERTTITITKPSLEKLPDYVYTKEYLERVNK